MSEFMLVDHPVITPYACIRCRSARGPLVDLNGESLEGRLYICLLCAKRIAMVAGFAEGERMDELVAASDLLVYKEREITSLLEQLGNAVMQIQHQERQIHDQDETIEHLGGRVSQLEKTLRSSAEDAHRHLELVGGNAP